MQGGRKDDYRRTVKEKNEQISRLKKQKKKTIFVIYPSDQWISEPKFDVILVWLYNYGCS